MSFQKKWPMIENISPKYYSKLLDHEQREIKRLLIQAHREFEMSIQDIVNLKVRLEELSIPIRIIKDEKNNIKRIYSDKYYEIETKLNSMINHRLDRICRRYERDFHIDLRAFMGA